MNLITTTDNVVKALTHKEGIAVNEFLKVTEGNEKGSYNGKTLNATNSFIVSALKKLEMVGIIRTHSLGPKGTHYHIINPFALKEIAERVSKYE